jgi:hypothetical protein
MCPSLLCLRIHGVPYLLSEGTHEGLYTKHLKELELDGVLIVKNDRFTPGSLAALFRNKQDEMPGQSEKVRHLD